MRGWLIRGLNMAVLWGIVQTVHARVELSATTSKTPTIIALAVLVAVAIMWAAVDTVLDRPERVTMWLKASLLGGVLGSLLGVVGQAAFVDLTGSWAIWPALTGGAAFVALAIFLPALLGVAIAKAIAPVRRPAPDDALE